MKRISTLGVLDLKAMTVTGKTVGEHIKTARVLDDNVIRPLMTLTGRKGDWPSFVEI